MALPTFHIQWDHAVAALRASQADEWTLKNWWHWPGSWIVFGGPVGRYVTGIVYGYRILQRAVLPDETGRKWQDLIMKPCLSVLGTVVFALLLAGFSLVWLPGFLAPCCEPTLSNNVLVAIDPGGPDGRQYQ